MGKEGKGTPHSEKDRGGETNKLVGGWAMNQDHSEYTVRFERAPEDAAVAPEILITVYRALKEKGYNPIHQMVGYLISGDPAYITSHQNARSLMRRLERDELLEELLKTYLAVNDPSRR